MRGHSGQQGRASTGGGSGKVPLLEDLGWVPLVKFCVFGQITSLCFKVSSPVK